MSHAGQLPARPGSIEHWAAKKPDVVAIHEGKRAITWSEWNDASNRLAQALVERGIVAGDIVAISCQIRIEWAVLNGALAKLDCPILGVNWRLTPSELDYVLSNSGARVFMCDAQDPLPYLNALSPLALKLAVSIDSPCASMTSWSHLLQAEAVSRVSERDAPAVIYTSGTTGLPRGVAPRLPETAQEVQQMREYAQSIAEAMRRTEDDVALLTLPFSHGSGPGVVRSSVTAGNTTVFLRRFDPEETLQLIDKHRVNIWVSVPTMLKRMACLPKEIFAKYDISSMRAIQTGAAPVPMSLKSWTVESFGRNILHESYGATEVGMIAHLSPEMHLDRPTSSGFPNRHVQISVRDSDGRPLQAGQTGEFWIRTPITIRGYLNAPPLDESTLDANGYFRTGDVGHLDDEGYVYITDRVKDMIISGGVNIYPVEIEAALNKHPSVQDVAVIGIPDEEFGEQVKAFVEVRPGHSLDTADLMDFVSDKLASYKRPKSIDIVGELPRNVMGKVLKRELRAPHWNGRERAV